MIIKYMEVYCLMNLKLNDNYCITSDTYSLMLNQIKTNNKTGNEYLVVVGYYGNLETLIKSLLEREVRMSDVAKITDLKNHLDKLAQDIIGTIKDENK